MLQFFAIVTAAIGIAAADTSAPQWESDYSKALQQTRQDNRPLLMVIDQPGVAEQSLTGELLSDGVGGALADYDLCHVDATTKYGKKVAAAFKAAKFPYVAVIDKDGKVILHQHSGKLTSSQWSEMVAKYRNGERPVQHVVAKPVVKTTPVSTAMPSYDSYQQYMPSSPRPYCAKCQRGY
jgi:hypothetical protein